MIFYEVLGAFRLFNVLVGQKSIAIIRNARNSPDRFACAALCKARGHRLSGMHCRFIRKIVLRKTHMSLIATVAASADVSNSKDSRLWFFIMASINFNRRFVFIEGGSLMENLTRYSSRGRCLEIIFMCCWDIVPTR